MGGCKILNDLFDRIYVPNKTEVLRLNVFNMITAINDSKTLTKHTTCESKWNFDGRRRNSNQNWNNDKCRCKRENTVEHQACEKDYMWNPVTWTGKNGWENDWLGKYFDLWCFLNIIKALRISFDKIDRLIRVYHWTRCLVFFSLGKFYAI